MIPYTSSEGDIKALFSKFGEVKEVFLMTNKEDGSSKVEA
jgi:RNA recognition motif-containing protein